MRPNPIIYIIISFFLASCAKKSSVSSVEAETGHTLEVNGKPIFINGMNWDYFPIGTNYTYSFWEQPDSVIHAGLATDMTLLKDMGVNTLRTYVPMPPQWITYVYDTYGIYTVINHSMGRYGLSINDQWVAKTNYADSLTKATILTEIKEVAHNYKNTRGLLMYLLGNENNYGLFWEGAETEDIPLQKANAEKQILALYQVFNEAAQVLKQIDPDKQVAICNGDIQYLDIIAKECTHVDILGINIYRGSSFDKAFTDIKKQWGKPVMFTEFGADAYDAISQKEDQRSQAQYLLSNWRELYQNAAGLGKAENCIGGFTFQFSDGWWKTGQTYNLDVHDSTASWSNGGYAYDYKKGQKNMNEEWFGICAKGKTLPNNTSPLYPRAAYYVLSQIHNINPISPNQTLPLLDSSFAKINLNEAVHKALELR